MKRSSHVAVLFLSCALVAGSATLIAAAATSGVGATPTCPSVGSGSGCAYVLTVNPNGSVAISPGANSGSYDGGTRGEGDDVVVGVVNNSNAIVSSIALAGTSNVFGFDGDGLCTLTFTSPVSSSYCQTNGPNGGPSFTTSRGKTTGVNPYDYQGPNNTFTNISTSGRTIGSGTIKFTTALPPQGTTFLSLEAPPTKTTATATLQPGLKVAAPALASQPVEGTPWNGQVATFTVQGSISPASEFTALIKWGDGTSSAGTLSGSSGSYVVSGSHTYAEEGPDSPTVTVTDPHCRPTPPAMSPRSLRLPGPSSSPTRR